MKFLVLTAKHHDGFCLWPTESSDYSVAAGSWRGGRGDIVKEVAAACHAQGIGFGIYLSPWDAYAWKVLKLDDAAYDSYYKQQLTELLTNYGPVMSVYWDGAGAQSRKHDWVEYYRLVKSLQSDTLVAWAGPSDIRWIWEKVSAGNAPFGEDESGLAPDPLWNVVNVEEHPKKDSPLAMWPRELCGNDYWWPAQAYTPIDSFWSGETGLPFGHKQDTVKSIDALTKIYHSSIGRGAGLVINFVPNKRGLLDDVQVRRVRHLGESIRHTYARDLIAGHEIGASSVLDEDHAARMAIDADPGTWWQAQDGVTDAWLEVDTKQPVTFERVVMQEAIVCGQRIRAYQVLCWDGTRWQPLSAGTSIGHKKIDVFRRVTAGKVRLHITDATASPTVRHFAVH
jgi:alpha-L-fucosidase